MTTSPSTETGNEHLLMTLSPISLKLPVHIINNPTDTFINVLNCIYRFGFKIAALNGANGRRQWAETPRHSCTMNKVNITSLFIARYQQFKVVPYSSELTGWMRANNNCTITKCNWDYQLLMSTAHVNWSLTIIKFPLFFANRHAGLSHRTANAAQHGPSRRFLVASRLRSAPDTPSRRQSYAPPELDS